MVRKYVRKSERGNATQEELEQGVLLVESGQSCRKAADALQLCHVTLYRYIKKRSLSNVDTAGRPASKVGYTKHRQVFTDEEENKISDYIKTASGIFYGLSPKEVRKLAFQCALVYGKKIPGSWADTQMAGPDWFSAFLKRNSSLSIRTPEPTSIARAMSFNKPNVDQFFDKLQDVVDRTKFEAFQIWNMDETGVTTVSKPSKVVAGKGIKQVGAVTSSERGVLVTMAVAVNAIGNAIPPMFIFPRVNYKDFFVRDGPPGCIGAANKSGWMMEHEFTVFMEHFVKNTRASTTAPVLLLLDNHSSHLSIDSINYARDNGVVMLSFPPHCTHRLQPLDRGVYGPFKKYVSVAQDNWIRNNPGKVMSIYDVPSLVKQALPQALTPSNISNAFRACGVFPFNRDIFGEDEFIPSLPSDRPFSSDDTSIENQIPAEKQISKQVQVSIDEQMTLEEQVPLEEQIPLTPIELESEPSTSTAFSPEIVRPHPRAARATTAIKESKRKRRSAVLTDTPEKNMLQKERDTRDAKNSKSLKNTNTKGKARAKVSFPLNPASQSSRSKQIRKSKNDIESSDEEEFFCLVCCEPYSTPRRKSEVWVQCIDCKLWAHNDCTEGLPTYICQNCDSDSD